jgi:hypothetical protein
MFFQITYRDIMASQPEVYQNTTLVRLGAAAQVAGAGFQAFQMGSNLTQRLSGQAQQGQQGQAASILSQGQQLIGALTTTANTINSTTQVMRAARVRLVGLTAGARTSHCWVDTNTGWVSPTSHPGSAAAAAFFNDQIQTVIFQVNAHDAAVKVSIAATAMGAVNFVMDAFGKSPASGNTPTTAIASGTGSGHPNEVNAGSGYGLSSAGTLSGARGLEAPRVAVMGGPGTAGVLTGSGGAAGLVGAGAGAAGGIVAGRGGAGAPLMGVGAAPMGAGTQGERETPERRQLAEDEDLWPQADVPDTNDGVLA